jgi:hypothetical protein
MTGEMTEGAASAAGASALGQRAPPTARVGSALPRSATRPRRLTSAPGARTINPSRATEAGVPARPAADRRWVE